MNQESNITPQEIERLFRLNIYGRWILVALSWLLIFPWGLWQMRETIFLCYEKCTWATIRIGMEFTPWGALAISFCIAFTTSVLVWQSIYILRGGLSPRQKYYLSQQVEKIKNQGEKHWLYFWLYPKV